MRLTLKTIILATIACCGCRTPQYHGQESSERHDSPTLGDALTRVAVHGAAAFAAVNQCCQCSEEQLLHSAGTALLIGPDTTIQLDVAQANFQVLAWTDGSELQPEPAGEIWPALAQFFEQDWDEAAEQAGSGTEMLYTFYLARRGDAASVIAVHLSTSRAGAADPCYCVRIERVEKV